MDDDNEEEDDGCSCSCCGWGRLDVLNPVNRPSLAGSIPTHDNPDCVSVPVLSQQTTSTDPAKLILSGSMQKIFDLRSLLIAIPIPTVKTRGSAGGTEW